MPERLPPRDSEWIDRTRPIRFRFEGRPYTGFAGDTLTSALLAAGTSLTGRSFKYHRPRGPMTLANHDVGILVEDVPHKANRRTNLRGDALPIAEGMDLIAVNTRGGVAGDWLRFNEWFASMMPVGFYYKAFHKPGFLFPIAERNMRKVAGLGAIDLKGQAISTPKRYDFCDLLVVGSGPAGLSAAIEAGRHGAKVLIVDEQPRAGGSFHHQWANDPDARLKMDELLDLANAMDNVTIRTGTQVAGCYADLWVALIDDQKLTKLRAGAMVVATGVFEQPAVFHNNDLPGVLLGSAARRMIHQFAIKPCRHAVVLAANADGYQTALDLHEAGVRVMALADLRPAGETTELSRRVAAAGIAVHPRHTVYEAHPGAGGVSAAVLAGLDDSGNPITDATIRVDCDGVIVSVGYMPNAGLLYQAGARFRYASHVEQFTPHTLPAGVFAAGRVNGVFSLQDQLADGRRAGLEAAKHLNLYSGEIAPSPVHRGDPPSHPYPIFPHPKGKNFVDFDEDIHLADLHNAHQEGYDNIELMKRYTTFGMGASQGKLGNMNSVRVLARLNGADIDQTGTTTSRPFHQPVPLSHLAGRRFHPLRRTAMHEWHKANGARMMHVGVWLRPEYYAGGNRSREDCILAEATHVRQKLGMIDVGTLGKIEVAGPDAAMFLERIYTGTFTSQQVGKLRYCLACDESGVIIDDGIVGRLADDRWYVTATTSGVDALFREMQRWAIIWRSKVSLMNVTGRYAAMNLAGPMSRAVLQTLADFDVSAEAMPYVTLRQGKVAGAPARVMRVGFVGELGYEIHVPSQFGMGVWNAIMNAGKAHDIRPFGVEAQRMLRLEKGHIIVSQDTDALTSPYEAAMEWALGKNKPFHIGERSLRILKAKPQTRKLVGIAFPKDYDGPLPSECHLVIDGRDIAGRVTSIARRSTLGYALGLAYVKPAQAEPGTTIQIRVDAGRMVQAQVVKLPFYDPAGDRQKM